MNQIISIGLFIALIWGILPVIQKHTLNSISPVTMMMFSAILYFLFISLYVLVPLDNRNKFIEETRSMSFSHWRSLIFISIIGVIASILYYYALAKYNSVKIVTLTSFWPLFGILFANIILNEPISIYLIGIISMIVGVIIYFENIEN